MVNSKQNLQVTVRGGLINVPHSTKPTQPPRHQPDTPRTKKHTTVKPDHQVYDSKTKPTPDQPPPTPTETEAPPPDEPQKDPPD